jgi:hypothetical protein
MRAVLMMVIVIAVVVNIVLWIAMVSLQRSDQPGSVLDDWLAPKALFDRENYSPRGRQLFPIFVASSIISMLCVVLIAVLRMRGSF